MTAPDTLFDADLSTRADSPNLVQTEIENRADWTIVDGELVHDPLVAWRWECPECGQTGEVELDDMVLTSSHGTQHSQGPFDTIVPLTISLIRRSDRQEG